ncbi:hypothetical protein [Sphingobium sp. HWE2-09]|uniref:hypothetical protein n=1 Tax=Sphingobium sp. HWE2-09 TaxID=3108390 RepID=UPI002DC0C23C|nr:hypothetical protein [Sphingobium sp. HWE2-09]
MASTIADADMDIFLRSRDIFSLPVFITGFTRHSCLLPSNGDASTKMFSKDTNRHSIAYFGVGHHLRNGASKPLFHQSTHADPDAWVRKMHALDAVKTARMECFELSQQALNRALAA